MFVCYFHQCCQTTNLLFIQIPLLAFTGPDVVEYVFENKVNSLHSISTPCQYALIIGLQINDAYHFFLFSFWKGIKHQSTFMYFMCIWLKDDLPLPPEDSRMLYRFFRSIFQETNARLIPAFE